MEKRITSTIYTPRNTSIAQWALILAYGERYHLGTPLDMPGIDLVL